MENKEKVDNNSSSKPNENIRPVLIKSVSVKDNETVKASSNRTTLLNSKSMNFSKEQQE